MERRGLFTKREWPVLLLILLAAGAALTLSWIRPGGVTAVVEVNGQAVMSRELGELNGPETVRIEGENGVVLMIEFSPEGARVKEANCHDGTCRRTGQISRAGEAAVCLPGRVVLRMEGRGSAVEIDAETY